MRWYWRDSPAGELVADCEAVLGGEYAEALAAAGRPIPVWAWINLLAHGSERQLRAAAIPRPGQDRWRQARSRVAANLMRLIDDRRLSLPEYQRDVLIPLELDVMACHQARFWSPAQLAAGLLSALRCRRHGRR